MIALFLASHSLKMMKHTCCHSVMDRWSHVRHIQASARLLITLIGRGNQGVDQVKGTVFHVDWMRKQEGKKDAACLQLLTHEKGDDGYSHPQVGDSLSSCR